jgi:hypothetical protein
MHAVLAVYRRSRWVLPSHARYAQHAKSLSWSESKELSEFIERSPEAKFLKLV